MKKAAEPFYKMLFNNRGSIRICRAPDAGESGGGGGEGGEGGEPGGGGGEPGGGGQTGNTRTIKRTEDPVPEGFKLPEGVSFDQLVPEEYRDKPYLKDAIEKGDIKEVFAKLDGAQKLIGQRPAGIPADDAPAEEWEKFYDSMGRPEDPKGYEFEVPEGVDRDEEFEGEVKQIFHKHGLTPKQALGVQKEFDALLADTLEKKGAAQKQLDKDFNKLSTEVFGDERVDAALSEAKALIGKYTPEKMKGHVENLSNENLIVLASVLDGINRDYISEDQGGGGSPSGGTPESVEGLRAEARKLMAKPEYSDSFKTGHKEVANRVTAIYKRISELEK